MNFTNCFKDKKILITGNSGFKGAWLTIYLRHLGANIIGISSKPHIEKSMHNYCGLENYIEQYYLDISDYVSLSKVIKDTKPDYIFHMAAQAITLTAYQEPRKTFETNVMGTTNILESLLELDHPCNVVIVTSDKCYRNNEWVWGYRENDVLAGIDPYSASKSMAELVTNSYYHSFFKKSNQIRVTTCRAGNVMGGGDWNQYRIVPDCIRAWMNNESLFLRNPHSIRPWNFVLDVLTGYLKAAAKLNEEQINGEAFNLGPDSYSEITVEKLVSTLWEYWGADDFKPYEVSKEKAEHFEHKHLKLNSEKSHYELGWKPIMNVNDGLKSCALWYKSFLNHPEGIYDFSLKQITDYLSALNESQ